MSNIKPEDHPDFVGGWVWTKLELDWINKRIGTLESALFQAQEAAKDLEARLTKTEGWLSEAVWNYGELKREQLANQEKTSSSPVEDWEAIAADQAMTIALLKAELAAPAREPEWKQIAEDLSFHGLMLMKTLTGYAVLKLGDEHAQVPTIHGA